ncbi:lysylphosphatidylglycerol synthase transmembrane domain-containing protein [Paraclostridium ghonii]|uniref:lysylphosphatidylglycerol synthase transmembrane domain-containing protein n=1 Tax=Paraclostridium ghonii TaxID=29358 RepID=UPI003525FBAA
MHILTKRQKDILQYTFLLFLIILTTYLVCTNLNINILSKIIKIINIKYIMLGFACILMYIILEAYIIKIILNSIHHTKSKSLSFNIGTMGLYYNLVTPLASGSQPMQIYALTKSKVPGSKATAVIVNKTVIFQTVVTIYCGILLLNHYVYLEKELNSVIILVATGMIMNVLALSFGILIIYSPKKTKKIVNLALNILKKIKIFKGLENKQKNVNQFIDEYNYSIKLFLNDKKSLIKSLVFTFIQLTLYFSIAYCVYRSLSLNSQSYGNMITLQAFLYMAVSPVPTPGNVGANEIAFFTIFKDVIPKDLLGYSVFLYGIFIYYFILLFCGIFTIRYHYKIKKINKNIS